MSTETATADIEPAPTAPSIPADEDDRSAPTTAPGDRDPVGRTWWPRDVVYAGITGVVSLLAGVFGLQFWRASPRVPITYSGDGLAVLTMAQAIDETGWWFTNPRLGAPFGLEHLDFPSGGESLQIALYRFTTLLSDDEALLTNAYFLLTFLLVGGAAYVALRLLHTSRLTSAVVGVVYSVLPFHLAHGTPHLWRSGYFAVPLAGVALLWLLGWDGGAAQRTGPRPLADLNWNWRRVLFIAGAAVLAGLTDTVAAAFPAVLAGVIAIALVVARRDLVAAGAAVAFALLAVLTVTVANLPTLLHQRANGANEEVLQRQPVEQEIFGLSPARLLTPIPDHRIGVLADFAKDVLSESRITSEPGQQLGLLGSVGLAGGAAWLLGSSVRTGRRRDRSDEPGAGADPSVPDRSGLVSAAAGLSLVAIAIATVGGLAFLASIMGFEELRTWNRIVVYIGFLALVVVAVAMDATRSRLRGARWAFPALAVGVGVLAVVDQTPATAPDYRANDRAWETDRAFFGAIEDAVGSDGQIFSLPVIPYPEPTRSFGTDYGHMRAVIHTDDLRSAYGGLRGREGRWLAEIQRLPQEVVLDALAASGFDGVHVDAWAYRGTSPPIGDALGRAPDLAAGERDSFWLLQDRRRDLIDRIGSDGVEALADEVLYPVHVRESDGVHPGDDASLSRFGEAESTLVLENLGDSRRSVLFAVDVRTAADAESVAVRVGDATTVHSVDDGVAQVRLELTLPPGDTTVQLSTDGGALQAAGDSRQIHMILDNARALGPVVESLVDSLDDQAAAQLVTIG